MTTRTPRVDFDSRYSDPQASHTDWQPAREVLATTELSWLTTVRPDGRPTLGLLITVWHDDAVHFCTGPEERKHKTSMPTLRGAGSRPERLFQWPGCGARG